MDRVPPLLRVAFGTLHSALLVAIIVFGLHLGGTAGDLLDGVGTLPGIVLYAYLWVLTWWSAGGWLADVEGSIVVEAVALEDAFRAGIRWGAATGGVFLAGLVVPASVFILVDSGLDVLLNFLVIIGIGLIASLLVGAAIGGMFTALDLGLARAARGLVPAAEATDTA